MGSDQLDFWRSIGWRDCVNVACAIEWGPMPLAEFRADPSGRLCSVCYGEIEAGRRSGRPEGQAGKLDTCGRESLRRLIAETVTADPAATNAMIRKAFEASSGVLVTEGAVRLHRRALGLPSAAMGFDRNRYLSRAP